MNEAHKMNLDDMLLPLDEAQHRVTHYEARIQRERDKALNDREYARSKQFEENMHEACAYWAESLVQMAYTQWRLK